MTNGTISEKCETLYNKLNSFVTSVINRDVTPQINNLQTGKADVGHLHTTTQVASQDALVNIGTSAGATQRMINGAIDSKVGSLDTSITNLNTLVKSGKVDGISVQKQNVAGYTVTHNLGRPNVPVVTLNIGNSSAYAWANTQATVYDVTDNAFKVKIYNNTASNGTFSFNWVVVATD